jgi:hypothetical protein
MPGLDPGIHHLREKHVSKKMDCRVKPGNDELFWRGCLKLKSIVVPDKRAERAQIRDHNHRR